MKFERHHEDRWPNAAYYRLTAENEKEEMELRKLIDRKWAAELLSPIVVLVALDQNFVNSTLETE